MDKCECIETTLSFRADFLDLVVPPLCAFGGKNILQCRLLLSAHLRESLQRRFKLRGIHAKDVQQGCVNIPDECHAGQGKSPM